MMPGELRAIPQLSPELWQLWCDTNGPTATFCVCWDDQGEDGCERPASHAYLGNGIWHQCSEHRREFVFDDPCSCSACRLRELVAWGETATPAEIEVAVSLFGDPAPMRELLDLAEASVALV